MAIRRQKVDFQAYMADCEANYWRIRKLLPEDAECRQYRIEGPDGKVVQLALAVEERCRYTTMVNIVQEGWGEWICPVHFAVRLYHDARMAEVFSCQHSGRVRSSYAYPNAGMFQPDEKFQQHRFLTECLRNCLKNGLTESTLPVL